MTHLKSLSAITSLRNRDLTEDAHQLHFRASGAKTAHGPVAQLVSAPPCHGGGRGFKSRLGRDYTFGWVAQLVRACD